MASTQTIVVDVELNMLPILRQAVAALLAGGRSVEDIQLEVAVAAKNLSQSPTATNWNVGQSGPKAEWIKRQDGATELAEDYDVALEADDSDVSLGRTQSEIVAALTTQGYGLDVQR